MMKRPATCFLCLVILTLSSSYPSMSQHRDTTPVTSQELQELTVRKGLPNFFTKALAGDSLRVAYLGGSITAQEGWRVYSLEWMEQNFPKAAFAEINAAIGGTASDFGAYRVQDQVLQFRPDLVLIEFAVNDSQKSSETTIRAMEGIVRQVWQKNPYTDICFVYTIKHTYVETEINGHLPSSKIAMEKVADHYGIPSVNFGAEVSRRVASNRLVVEADSLAQQGTMVFSRDGVHPYLETGHRIYHEVLARSLETIQSKQPLERYEHRLLNPLTRDYYADTRMVDLTEITMSEQWKLRRTDDLPYLKKFNGLLPQIGKADHTGQYLALRFSGTAIGAYDIKGPSAGKVLVEIDGIVHDTIPRFDAYCTYYRMSYFLIDDLKDTTHQVVFKVLAEPFDKAAILAQRGEVMENKDDYQENNWFVGKILMNGTLLGSP